MASFVTLEAAKKAHIIIDASALDLFCLCNARYNYRYNLRRGLPVIQKNRSLDKGSLTHEGYKVYYELLKNGEPFKQRLEAMKQKIRLVSSNPLESNMDAEEVEILLRTLQQNLEFWQWEDENLEILAVEQPFADILFEDDEVKIILSGQIDLLVNKPPLNGSAAYSNLPVDHKTYSRDSPVGELSNQFMNYASAVDSNYIVINRIGLQSMDVKNPLSPDEKYKRLPLSYDSEILQQWRDNVRDIILEQYVSCVASGIWPMNFTSCLKFNRLCEYYDVCKTSGKNNQKFKLENNYVDTDPWDVTKKMEEQ